jgi:LAO/AO transport system kinase
MDQKKKKSALSVQPGVAKASSLNPDLAGKIQRSPLLTAEQYVEGILNGNISILSRAITLVESQLDSHQEIAEKIINACLPHSGHSLRIGITGIPGVGKSTFIESFGLHLIFCEQKKVAVLAVDPSSERTKGSIMGDKTRMERLAQHPDAFIRPSPSAGSLGGVARKTRETAILCEAAGFNIILIETVGVGQSETAVNSMVDFFLLLLLPGAGDELQGIKRGIMEMADGIAINKADGENLRKAQVAAGDVKRALQLFPKDEREWHVPVLLCSALENTGIDELWNSIDRFWRHMMLKGHFMNKRHEQAAYWLRETITASLVHDFQRHPLVIKKYQELEKAIKDNMVSPFSAARELLAIFKNSD